MDRTNDLILGVLGGPWVGDEGYPGIEAYVESIRRSGFTGRKVMLCWDIRTEVRTRLEKNGFELVNVDSYGEPFFTARMHVCSEYLKEHHNEFRYIFWLDIKDLVVQSDPSTWMEENIGSYKLIGSTECVSIEREETNQIWSRSITGVDRYLTIMDEEVINGGTWAGESFVMSEVFAKVYQECRAYKGGFPPCQASINWVMRQSPFKEVLYIPRWSEGFAACLHPVWWVGARYKCFPYLKDRHPVFDLSTALLYPGMGTSSSGHSWVEFNPHCPTLRKTRKLTIKSNLDVLTGVECITDIKTKPFCIVHGYDRDFDMQGMFEYKYRYSGDFNLEEYKKYNELKVPAERRSLRAVKRPHAENLAFGGVLSPTKRTLKRR